MTRAIAEPAIFSPGRAYRYTLYRDLDPLGLQTGVAAWIALNPSTADESKNDPTVTREMNFSRSWGYRHFVKLNLFGFRSTDPKPMLAHADPVGPDNDAWIREVCAAADIIVLAWGAHGTHRGRNVEVLRMLRPWADRVHLLALTKHGHPGHPLYLKASLTPTPCADLIPSP